MGFTFRFEFGVSSELRNILNSQIFIGNQIMDAVNALDSKISDLENNVSILTSVNAAQVASINSAVTLLGQLKGDLEAAVSGNDTEALAALAARVQVVSDTISGVTADDVASTEALDGEVAKDAPTY